MPWRIDGSESEFIFEDTVLVRAIACHGGSKRPALLHRPALSKGFKAEPNESVKPNSPAFSRFH
jgi:hypothetical protein